MNETEIKSSLKHGQNLIAGGLLILLGSFASYTAWTEMPLGTLDRMGPGMFPFSLGIILIMLGLAIGLPSIGRNFSNPLAAMDLRSFAYVTASIIIFGIVVPFFGLVPAIFLLVLTASRADNAGTFKTVLWLSALLSVLIILTFKFGLDVRISVLTWPW